MATVVFLDENIRVKVPAGMPMRTVAERCGSSMEFGCRVGDCTTCAAQVKAGSACLSDMTEKEAAALQMIDGEKNGLRLMCQCTVSCDEGEIVISQRF